MASKRNLKKDINYLSNDLVNECLVFQTLNKKADSKKVDQVIGKVLVNRTELVSRVNKLGKSDASDSKKEVNKILDSVEKELIGALDELKDLAK